MFFLQIVKVAVIQWKVLTWETKDEGLSFCSATVTSAGQLTFGILVFSTVKWDR